MVFLPGTDSIRHPNPVSLFFQDSTGLHLIWSRVETHSLQQMGEVWRSSSLKKLQSWLGWVYKTGQKLNREILEMR